MKIQEIYIADDGTRFDDRQKCVEYDTLYSEVCQAMVALPARPDDCGFANGGGYIQHKSLDFERCKLAFLKIVGTVIKDPSVEAAKTRLPSHCILGRFIDDGGIECFRGPWLRFECTDSQYREWGQQYFVHHPNPCAVEL